MIGGEREVSDRGAAVTPAASICGGCRRETRFTPWPQLAGMPMCPECTAFLRKRPYPVWVRVFFGVVAALVILSTALNLRFVRAHFASRAMWAALQARDFETAAARAGAAAGFVPETPELSTLNDFCQGLACIENDRAAEAVKHFGRCRKQLPPGYGVDSLLAQARCIAAFDVADYDGFLAESRAIAAARPKDAAARAGVASALACKYATTTNEAFRAESLLALDRARVLAGPDDAEFGGYEQRIRHRLHAREIITKKAFDARFPDGWSADESARETRP